MKPCGTVDHSDKTVAKKPDRAHAPFICSSVQRLGLIGLAQIIGFLLCLVLVAVAQVACGPAYPADDRVVIPQIAMDGQGNVVTLYQVTGLGPGHVTYVQKLSPEGERLWGEKGVRLDEREPNYPGCLNVDTSSYPQMVVVDDGGNTMVFWTYQGQIYAEKLDSNGSPLWQPERLVVGAFPAPGGPYTRWAVAANATGHYPLTV